MEQVCRRSRFCNRPEDILTGVDVLDRLLDDSGTVSDRLASMKSPETTDDRPIVRAATGR
jgi:hypothetical protein